MSKTPKAVLERFHEAEARYMSAGAHGEQEDFSELRKTLSSNVLLHQSPDLPFGGEYRGHDGYERGAVQMSAIFDLLEVSEKQFLEQGDTIVMVCRFRTRSRRTGQVQDYPMVQVVRTEDGHITDFRPFYWNVPAYVAAV